MNYKAIFIILILLQNKFDSIPIAHKDCFTWELCDAIGCTDRHDCWLGHTVGGFGDCEDCLHKDHRGYGYDCFSKETHYLECKCVSYANPKGCQKSTTQYAKAYFESYYGINVQTKSVVKKINLLDINKGSDFVKGIKNLCKVVDATKDVMDFLDNPLKKLIQETTHTIVEGFVDTIFKNTPLKKFEGISDFISIGINFALDQFLFSLRNLGSKKIDESYFDEMFNYADKINQKRGIALIKGNGINNFNDKDYFGYNDFSAMKIKRDNLRSISDLSKDDVNNILSDKDWKNEEYFILIKTKTNNEELNEVYNYKKISLYAYNKEEIVFSDAQISSSAYNICLSIKYYLLSIFLILISI